MTPRSVRALALFAALSPSAAAQVFVRNTTDVPNQGAGLRYAENVDFADVDLDGDWDAAFAHGGDFGNLQDRLWINAGGLQGGSTGTFTDETASRFPVVSRDGRDVEFVDVDNDGDVDLYVSNTSTVQAQSSQWLTNAGGSQGGTLGFFTDDTEARWIELGVGGPQGSSIAPSHLIGGGFIDWAGDADFADLDNDGDLDLVHTTYGGSFSGVVPTRLFLNNGSGRFREFNPSGHQLASSSIATGAPGLWCEGTQLHDTTDTTGTTCDVATNGMDVEIADIDGDFDLDLVQGERTSETRFYRNRLEESGGLAFRDETHAIYPPGWTTGFGHYEQELGDFDGDNDVDLFGLNWLGSGTGFDDSVMENVGGVFAAPTVLAGSSFDDSEGDFGDYDNDGDLDLFVANFSGTNRLYEGDGSGGFTLLADDATGSGLAEHGFGSNPIAWDADWCDVDGDGDADVFVANDTTFAVVYWQNQTGVPDTTAPRVAPVEDVGRQVAGIAGSSDVPVRTHVYDNAAYYTTWYAEVELQVEVDGLPIDELPARSSGGQVFRAELPSNLVGAVTYRFEAADQYGNVGASADVTYASTTALTHEVVYGTGTAGTTGSLHELHARSLATAGKPLYLTVETGGVPTIYSLAISLASIAPTPITDLGILNIDPFQIVLQRLGVTNASGLHVREFPISGTVPSGFSIYAQVFGLDGAGGDTWSSSRGVEIPFH